MPQATITAKILLVDDDPGFARAVAAMARQCGCTLDCAPTLAGAHARLQAQGFDLILVDVRLRDGSGLDLLDDLALDAHGRIAIVTAAPSVESALRVLHSPVVDYFVKPVPAATLRQLLMDARVRAGERVAVAHSAGIVGNAPCMHALLGEIAQVGPSDVSVLVQGESGTGKELVARALHAASGRSGAFVAVNCGALAQDLLGSLLFGHERGAFTGAVQPHPGYFEQAEGGTLFLDEITEMPHALQVYLLRILETRTLTRVGGTRELPVDVRVVAATNRDPQACVAVGTLRQDLYYRLNGFCLHTPALRERREDVPLLARHFLDALNRRHDTAKRFAADVPARLADAEWPGNVRELRHAVQRSYLLARAGSQVAYQPEARRRIPAPAAADDIRFRVGMSFEDVEREMLLKTLRSCDNNKTRAARILGITSKTIYNRLVRYRAVGLVDDAILRGMAASPDPA